LNNSSALLLVMLWMWQVSVTMVHFSSRDLPKSLLGSPNGKIYCSRSKKHRECGGSNVWRLLTSKGFSGLGNGSKPKTYSTLASVVPLRCIGRERVHIEYRVDNSLAQIND
jgi:hypothetical protein